VWLLGSRLCETETTPFFVKSVLLGLISCLFRGSADKNHVFRARSVQRTGAAKLDQAVI